MVTSIFAAPWEYLHAIDNMVNYSVLPYLQCSKMLNFTVICNTPHSVLEVNMIYLFSVDGAFVFLDEQNEKPEIPLC